MIKTSGHSGERHQKTHNSQWYECRKCQCIQENVSVLIQSASKFGSNEKRHT